MPYESRFGNTRRGNRAKHDPAVAGIFVHGGTCNAGPFAKTPGGMSGANHFSISLPTQNKRGEEFNWSAKARHGQPTLEWEATGQNHPTFQRAVTHAVKVRQACPELAACDIYACTDMHMDTPSSGQYKIQRVA